MRKILLVQGANLTYLGKREPEIYGTTTAEELNETLLQHSREKGYQLEIFYSNIEGEAINRIYEAADAGTHGLVMNPAGFTYAGYALKDCIKGAGLPYVEIHISNIAKPVAVAFPTANQPLVIDVATSAIPAFELARHRLFGRALPPGAALDDQGHDTDDPELAKSLKTFGDSPKSSALALMVEVLTGPFVKASFAGVGDTLSNWGNLIVAIDPEIFVGREQLEAEVDKLLQSVRTTRPRPGFGAVRLPGESARARARQVEASGYVEIDDELWKRVRDKIRPS